MDIAAAASVHHHMLCVHYLIIPGLKACVKAGACLHYGCPVAYWSIFNLKTRNSYQRCWAVKKKSSGHNLFKHAIYMQWPLDNADNILPGVWWWASLEAAARFQHIMRNDNTGRCYKLHAASKNFKCPSQVFPDHSYQVSFKLCYMK